MAEPIIISGIFRDYILPFLLVFTLLFAILEKSKILGDGKKQINAIVSLVIALLTVSFSYATGIIVKMMPFLAVVGVIILVFMILFGLFISGKEGFEMPKWMKGALSAVIVIAGILFIIWATGQWDALFGSFSSSPTFWMNALFIVVIIAAIVIVLFPNIGGGKKE
ncbi:hypothetical protein COV15_02710 [Candidatus Woesearchaeota archaeon CG10_big_fil_rev_8_21_14_0_10_34_12]|nr:MAG: hypothetical protein COV15_02710 [Candidatus Woesearchaeota archaeon CG10_big_fil_rev_8_21_14_0_10_34_12]